MGKLYKISPEQTLKAANDLYLKKILSYPRTNSSYYATGEKEKIANLLTELSANGYKVSLKDKVFNDKYVESHGALRITKLADQSAMSEVEAKVYNTVLTRMLAIFCSEDCIVDETLLSVKVGSDEVLDVKGRVIIQQGYLMYEDSGEKDKVLPSVEKGEHIPLNFKPVEKETQPPKHYTIETLNGFCENPFRKDSSENEDEDFKALVSGLAIGTGATRAGLFKNAIENEYISLKKGTYFIEPNGIFVIESLEKLQINMDKYKTAEIGKVLKQVYNGEVSLPDGIKIAEKKIDEYFSNALSTELEKAAPAQRDVIGKCPKCQGDVLEGRANFYCSNKECDFALFKENKWWTMKKKSITKTYAKALLKDGKVKVKGFYSAEKNKTYDATVVMTMGEKYPSFSLKFD